MIIKRAKNFIMISVSYVFGSSWCDYCYCCKTRNTGVDQVDEATLNSQCAKIGSETELDKAYRISFAAQCPFLADFSFQGNNLMSQGKEVSISTEVDQVDEATLNSQCAKIGSETELDKAYRISFAAQCPFLADFSFQGNNLMSQGKEVSISNLKDLIYLGVDHIDFYSFENETLKAVRFKMAVENDKIVLYDKKEVIVSPISPIYDLDQKSKDLLQKLSPNVDCYSMFRIDQDLLDKRVKTKYNNWRSKGYEILGNHWIVNGKGIFKTNSDESGDMPANFLLPIKYKGVNSGIFLSFFLQDAKLHIKLPIQIKDQHFAEFVDDLTDEAIDKAVQVARESLIDKI